MNSNRKILFSITTLWYFSTQNSNLKFYWSDILQCSFTIICINETHQACLIIVRHCVFVIIMISPSIALGYISKTIQSHSFKTKSRRMPNSCLEIIFLAISIANFNISQSNLFIRKIDRYRIDIIHNTIVEEK